MRDVAKAHQIDEIKQETTQTKDKVEAVEARVAIVEDKMSSFEERLKRLEQGAPAAHGSRGTATPCSQRSGGDDTGWRPRIVHLRGWSPFRAGPESKIGRDQAKVLQAAVTAAMSAEWVERVRWLQPSVRSRAVSAELLLVENISEVKKLADYNVTMTRANIKVRSCPARAVVETNPKRRHHLRLWHQSREMLAMLNPGTWNSQMTKRIRFRDNITGSGMWNNCAAAQEGLRLPCGIGGDDDAPEEKNAPKQEERDKENDDDKKSEPPQLDTTEDEQTDTQKHGLLTESSNAKRQSAPTWNTQRAGMEFAWNLPDTEHDAMKCRKDFKQTDSWLIHESYMSNGDILYNTTNKSAECHKFIYNERNHTDTMMVIHKDVARRA